MLPARFQQSIGDALAIPNARGSTRSGSRALSLALAVMAAVVLSVTASGNPVHVGVLSGAALDDGSACDVVPKSRSSCVLPDFDQTQSDGQQDLGGGALVHGLVALGGPVEGQGEVEDPAGVDLPVPDLPDGVE